MIVYPKKVLLATDGTEDSIRAARLAVATTMRRSTLGRASDVIVRTAPCPVLVVRGDTLPLATGSR